MRERSIPYGYRIYNRPGTKWIAKNGSLRQLYYKGAPSSRFCAVTKKPQNCYATWPAEACSSQFNIRVAMKHMSKLVSLDAPFFRGATVASIPGLPVLALTIIHGCGRAAKNGEGLVSFIT